MIYAIPNDGERVANHFVKAPYIAIYSDTDGMLKNLANIASMPQAGCNAKSQLIQSLQGYNVDAVLVRNIGERVLAKLLSSGTPVFRLSTRSSLEDVLAVPREPLIEPLKDAHQTIIRKVFTNKKAAAAPVLWWPKIKTLLVGKT